MSDPVCVTGLFEAHLAVADLDRSVAFYRDVVGQHPAYEDRARGAAFLWIGGPGEGLLGLWSLGSAPIAVSSHVALRASLTEVLRACGRLRSVGVTPLSFAATETDEPSVLGWMPAAAVYFRDPDGHLLEYLAMLDAPPDPAAGVIPWSTWNEQRPPTRRRLRVTRHTGPRDDLRPLFELAEDSAAELDSYLGCGDVLVADNGDGVIGHLQLVGTGTAKEAEIRNMAVAPAHRRRGIGTALVEAAVERARREGRTSLVVATAAADVNNLRFYQRVGFRFRSVERDAFTSDAGYAPDLNVDGIALRDRVVLDLQLEELPFGRP